MRKRGVISFIVLSFVLLAGGIAAQPEKFTKSFAEITRRVSPSVVSIETKFNVPESRGVQPPAGGGDLLDMLQRQQRPVTAVGSGFIVDKTGYVLTNAHVVTNSSRITVKLDSGDELIAKVVGSDEETDLAVLKIEAGRELPVVKFADSDRVEVGEWVLAIGSPFGLAKTVTAGIISQTRRETPSTSAFQRFIQTDAAINRGNSGGPLVNMDGEVIGVNSQIATSTGDYNGVGFALPSREAEQVYAQLVKSGRVRRGFLGVLLDSVKPEFAAVYGLKDARGAIVTDVRDKQSPAALAGIRQGDIITDFNGQAIGSAQDLISRVAATLPDQTITLGYFREAGDKVERGTATIKLGERPSNRAASDTNPDRRSMPVNGRTPPKPFGLTLSELTAPLASEYNLEGLRGLIVREVNPSSYVADLKTSNGGEALRPGDLIQRMNRVAVTDLKIFSDAVGKLVPSSPVVLHVALFNPQTQSVQQKIVQFTVR